ncbi:hypothetical protein V6N13_018742 [Hibiscus sabdariffa]
MVLRHCAELDVSEICHGGCEDIDHVLRSCSAAKGVWEWVIPLGNRFEFFDLPFIDWLQRNLFATASASSDTDWSARFAIICWLLWKRRCALIFTLAVGVVDDILDRSNRVVAECRRAFDNRTISLPVSVPESRWRTPKTAWVKVEVHHVGHGCNRAADRMAASGRGLLLMATTFPEAPDGVQEIVVDEMN